MDKLAEACGVDPIELRLRNAMGTGDTLLTGQVVTGALPVAEVIRACATLPDARDRRGRRSRWSDPAARDGPPTPRTCAAASGFAVGFKNLMYAEGYDDVSTARCRLEDGLATVTCAAAEVGQGFVTLVQQIARTVLGVARRAGRAGRHVDRLGRVHLGQPPDDDVGRAVEQACQKACEAARVGLEQPVTGELDVVDGRSIAVDRRSAVRGDRSRHQVPHRSRNRSTPTARATRTCRGLRRAPRRGRRRPRARSRAGGPPRHRAGRRQGAQPGAVPRTDRGRHRAGRRARGDGGAPDRRTAGCATRASPTT